MNNWETVLIKNPVWILYLLQTRWPWNMILTMCTSLLSFTNSHVGFSLLSVPTSKRTGFVHSSISTSPKEAFSMEKNEGKLGNLRFVGFVSLHSKWLIEEDNGDGLAFLWFCLGCGWEPRKWVEGDGTKRESLVEVGVRLCRLGGKKRGFHENSRWKTHILARKSIFLPDVLIWNVNEKLKSCFEIFPFWKWWLY